MRLVTRAIAALPYVTLALLLLLAGCLLLVRVNRTVEAPGTVQVERYEIVRAEVGGIVERVDVDAGSRVREGSTLLVLRDTELDQRRLAAEQELSDAEGRRARLQRELETVSGFIQPLEIRKGRLAAEQAQIAAQVSATAVAELRLEAEAAAASFRRTERLAGAGLLSEQELEAADIARKTAEQRLRGGELDERRALQEAPERLADLRLLEAQHRKTRSGLEEDLHQVERQIRRTRSQLDQLAAEREALTVRAHLDGVVTDLVPADLLGRRIEPGERVLAVIDAGSIDFVARVSDLSVARLEKGQEARVAIAGLSAQRRDPFEGIVQRIGQQPVARAATDPASYDVEIRLSQPWLDAGVERLPLRGGMRGRVEIVYRRNLPLLAAMLESLLGEGDRTPPTGSPADKRTATWEGSPRERGVTGSRRVD